MIVPAASIQSMRASSFLKDHKMNEFESDGVHEIARSGHPASDAAEIEVSVDLKSLLDAGGGVHWVHWYDKNSELIGAWHYVQRRQSRSGEQGGAGSRERGAKMRGQG
jgi:hypothetical protein